MNKLFSKIGVAIVGMAMAIGVGVAVSYSNKEVKIALATPEPAAIEDSIIDFEANSAHHVYAQGTSDNDFTGTTHYYTQFSSNDISLTYADSTTSGSPLNDSAHIIARVAKNTTNSPVVILGPVDLSDYVVTGIKYNTKSVSTLTVTSYYSTNGSTWTQYETHAGNSSAAMKGSDNDLELSEPSSLYFKVIITVTNSTSTGSNRDTNIDNVTFYGYLSKTPVSSLSISGTDVSENALTIGSSDENAHTITVSINNDAYDKQINIAHKSGTNGLFALGNLTDGHITCNASGVGTFTVTGTGGTTGSETFSITSHGTPSKTLDFVVSALNDSATYYDIALDENLVDYYHLSGNTHIESGQDASITLVPEAKYNLPSAIDEDTTGAGVYDEDWTYDNNDGSIVIYDLSSNVEISFDANPADFIVDCSGAKTTFKQGDAFSSTGLVVNLVYDDAEMTTEVVNPGDYTINSNAFVSNTPGTYEIIVTHTESSKTGSYNVTIKAVISYTYSGIDELTRGLINVTGKDYENWSDISVSDGSSAVYAGNSAGFYKNGDVEVESIQIRSTSSNSGIISTTSGGLVTKVAVEWNSQTADARTLNIYGKNTSYSSASDLYSNDSNVQGTLIGTIVCGTSTELNIATDYAYVGIRSNSGAIYLDGIDISWSQTEAAEADVTIVNAFINNYMHPEIAHNTDPNAAINNTGDCDTEGWYSDAKTAFNALKTRQKAIILTSSSTAYIGGTNPFTYNQIKDRLLAWATANHESLNESTKTLGAVNNGGLSSIINNESNNTIVAIIIIASISTLAIGGYFFIRRRKHD